MYSANLGVRGSPTASRFWDAHEKAWSTHWAATSMAFCITTEYPKNYEACLVETTSVTKQINSRWSITHLPFLAPIGIQMAIYDSWLFCGISRWRRQSKIGENTGTAKGRGKFRQFSIAPQDNRGNSSRGDVFGCGRRVQRTAQTRVFLVAIAMRHRSQEQVQKTLHCICKAREKALA